MDSESHMGMILLEYSFTHRLDLSNPNDDDNKARAREIGNKYNWNKIVGYIGNEISRKRFRTYRGISS